MTDLTPGRLAQVACVLEATARKPGNVHRFADFADTSYLDFVLSAQAIGPALDRAGAGIGPAVLDAVRATRAVVATNTNLGMVLLLAPLCAVPAVEPLRAGVSRVLDATTVDDTRAVYAAVRLSRPGGLGTVAEQDVASEPTLPLRGVMALAANRDAVARQYVNGFADVFDHAVPALAASLKAGYPLEAAIISAHLHVLATMPDTLIARKRGAAVAAEAARRAAEVLNAGGPAAPVTQTQMAELDRWLRADGNARNPGATADLVTAALFACLRDATIQLPLTTPMAGLPPPP
jgi:triphosphoribosyl-dephospho-CoA synthase